MGDEYVAKFSKKKAPCAYYTVRHDGTVEVKFGPSKAQEDARRKAEEEAKEAERAAREAQRKKEDEIRSKIVKILTHDDDAPVKFEKLLDNYFSRDKESSAEKMLLICSKLELDFSEAQREVEIDAVKTRPVAEFLDLFGEHLDDRATCYRVEQLVRAFVNTFDCTGFLTQDEIDFITREEEEA